MANRLIWGMVLAVSLGLATPSARAVPPENIFGPVEAIPDRVRMSHSQESDTPALIVASAPSSPLREAFTPGGGHLLQKLLNPQKWPAPLPGAPRTLTEVTPMAPSRQPAAVRSLPHRVLARAYDYLNTPYRRGGSLETGSATDCSGFVQHIFGNFAIDLPRSSAQQAQVGQVAAHTLDFARMQPGDLLFFRRGRGRIDHVGIYLGEGKMIHATTRRRGVAIDDLQQSYYTRSFVVAKRVLEAWRPR